MKRLVLYCKYQRLRKDANFYFVKKQCVAMPKYFMIHI